MFGFRKKISREEDPRVPIYKRADCLGGGCPEFGGTECESRLELLEATGKSGGKDLGPKIIDCSFALYGQVCMAGEEQVVVSRVVESPNGQADALELVGRSGQTEGQRIVLDTPLEAIQFAD